MKEIQELEKMASQVRRDIVRMVSDVASGHPGGSLGTTDLMVALYFNILKHDPKTFTMEGLGQDAFYLSCGHVAPVWYSVLARSGYFPVKELASFRRFGSILQGHPAPAKGIPGVRVASGSLGQGLSCAIGHALGKKMQGDKNYVFALMGDGETQEGQVWEAAMVGSAKKLDNLIAIVDWNNQQIDGSCDDVITLGDYPARWAAFGWNVMMMDGHNIAEIIATIAKAKEELKKGKPVIILMKTTMGQGVDYMMGTNAWHGKTPNEEMKLRALEQLEETFGDY